MKTKARGSYTLEAAFIVPMILFFILAGIQVGLSFYTEVKADTEIQTELKELDPVDIVRKHTILHQVIKGE